MPINAIGELITRKYTPDSELDNDGNPVDGATTFDIRPLSGVDYNRVIAHQKYDPVEQTVSTTGDGVMLALSHGLVGWDGLIDPVTGLSLKYNHVNLNRLPPVIIRELAGKIIEISELGTEAAKN